MRCTGEPQTFDADEDGALVLQVRRDKEATHLELASSGRCRLIVLASGTGGWWSEARCWSRARGPVIHVPAGGVLALEQRWTRMFATTCATAVAVSMVAPVSHCDRGVAPRPRRSTGP